MLIRRAYLIGRLRHPERYFRFPEHVTAALIEDCTKAADMLEADAQEIARKALVKAKEAQQVAVPQEPNNNEVICPNCCTQFRAIPVNVQRLMLDVGFEPPFMAAPQPAAYVPLTDEQIEEITADNSLDTIHAVARAIEQAVRGKT